MSIASVTRASLPSTASALVGTMFLSIILRARGRVAISAAMDTAKNSTTCSHMGASQMAAMSPAALPKTNQMDTSPTVTASTTPKTTIAAIQMTISISAFPPFRHNPIKPASSATPSRMPAASHLFRGERLLTKAATDAFSGMAGDISREMGSFSPCSNRSLRVTPYCRQMNSSFSISG